MNDTVKELTDLEAKAHENLSKAEHHEKLAKQLRTERDEIKAEAAKIRKVMTDAALVDAATGTLAQAKESAKKVEEYGNQLKVALDDCRAATEAAKAAVDRVNKFLIEQEAKNQS